MLYSSYKRAFRTYLWNKVCFSYIFRTLLIIPPLNWKSLCQIQCNITFSPKEIPTSNLLFMPPLLSVDFDTLPYFLPHFNPGLGKSFSQEVILKLRCKDDDGGAGFILGKQIGQCLVIPSTHTNVWYWNLLSFFLISGMQWELQNFEMICRIDMMQCLPL